MKKEIIVTKRTTQPDKLAHWSFFASLIPVFLLFYFVCNSVGSTLFDYLFIFAIICSILAIIIGIIAGTKKTQNGIYIAGIIIGSIELIFMVYAISILSTGNVFTYV